MVLHRFGVIAVLVLCHGLVVEAQAQSSKDLLISTRSAERIGLDVAWRTHVQVNRSRGEIVDVTQHISNENSKTVFEVSYAGRKEIITENQLNPFGTATPAKEHADLRAEILTAEGYEVEIKEVTIPSVTLYFTTNQGLIHAVDGETGQTKWVTPLGNSFHPTMPLAVNDKYLAAVHGSTLYCLNPTSGELLWSRECSFAPGNGPAITNDFILVPMINGKVEAFKLWDHKQSSEWYVSVGRALNQPTVTETSISWATDRGHLNVAMAHPQIRGISYRLEAEGTIVSSSVAAPPERLIVASVDGFVHCMDEVRGTILWQASTGDPISQTPVVLGDKVFANTDIGDLYCVSLDNGVEHWVTGGISRFLAASEKHIYCLAKTERLLVLDIESGSIVSSISIDGVDFSYVNQMTDRIILGSKTGAIQCLREFALEQPMLHVVLPKKEDEADRTQRSSKPKATGTPAEDDPFGGPGDFGGGDDPFGGSATPATETDDPFGSPF